MAGIALAEYQGWLDTTSVDETRELDEDMAFDENTDVSELLNYIFDTTSTANYYEKIASWESRIINLAPVGRIQDAFIQWTADIPTLCAVAVYTSLYDGALWLPWQIVANHSPIPGLTLVQAGRDVTECKIRVKIEAFTADTNQTPNVTELKVIINSRKILRLIPDGTIQFAGTVTQSAEIAI